MIGCLPTYLFIMKYIIFSVLLVINKCFAGEFKVTEKPITSTTLSSSNYVPILYSVTAVHNKPLDVVVPKKDMIINQGWCNNYYYDDDLLEAPMEFHWMGSHVHIPKVTYKMSTLWNCSVVTQKYEVKKSLLYFKFHIKSAKSVQLFVNGSELTLNTAVLSAPYDGETIYFYENGDFINIVCKNPHSTGTIFLQYFKKGVTTVSFTATFGIHLHIISNNSYVDCIYTSTLPDDKYVYRVTFVTTKQSIHLNNNSDTGKTLPVAHPSANPVKDKGFPSSAMEVLQNCLRSIVGSSVGAGLLILGVVGVTCCYRRSRNVQHIVTPSGDITNENNCPTPQIRNECENDYDYCHDEDVYYTEIDYSRCKQKTGEARTRISKVYDEPYVI